MLILSDKEEEPHLLDKEEQPRSSDIDGEEKETNDEEDDGVFLRSDDIEKEKDMKNLTREVQVIRLQTIRQESVVRDEEFEAEQHELNNPRKCSSELQLKQCLFHRVVFIHEIRMMKMRDEATFVDIDDFLRLYTGDYLLLENVVECFDLVELLFCIYNSKSRKFHLIRTRVNRQNYRRLEQMKNHFVKFDYKNRDLEVVQNGCSCYYHL